jgi:hypothetical protein
MEHGNLHSLIPPADFKAVLGLDDREDALSHYCLITATYSIEQYCKRRLLRKKRFKFFPFYGDYIFPLRDYPVWEILAIYQTHALKEAIIVEPDLYHKNKSKKTVNLYDRLISPGLNAAYPFLMEDISGKQPCR